MRTRRVYISSLRIGNDGDEPTGFSPIHVIDGNVSRRGFISPAEIKSETKTETPSPSFFSSSSSFFPFLFPPFRKHVYVRFLTSLARINLSSTLQQHTRESRTDDYGKRRRIKSETRRFNTARIENRSKEVRRKTNWFLRPSIEKQRWPPSALVYFREVFILTRNLSQVYQEFSLFSPPSTI